MAGPVKMPIPCLDQSIHLIRPLAVMQAHSNRIVYATDDVILPANLCLDAQIGL